MPAVQAQVTAPTGYLISCVTYLVSGDYAVYSRERTISLGTRGGSSGPTYRFSEASAGSPTVVQTGCLLTDPVPVVEIEAIIKSGAGAAARFVLGYTMEAVPASAHDVPKHTEYVHTLVNRMRVLGYEATLEDIAERMCDIHNDSRYDVARELCQARDNSNFAQCMGGRSAWHSMRVRHHGVAAGVTSSVRCMHVTDLRGAARGVLNDAHSCVGE